MTAYASRVPWIKIPPENLELFRAALPPDRRIETLHMFGGLAAKIKGRLFGGAFGRSVMLLLSDQDRDEALALEGAAPFDPMGTGARRSDKVQMPESMMDDADELRAWVRRAYDHAQSLPAKPAKPAKTKVPAKPKNAIARVASRGRRRAPRPSATSR